MADSTPLPAQERALSGTTTVTFNRRAAKIPFGRLFHLFGIDHVWISTPDCAAAGFGDASGVPQSELPLVKMSIVDHRGQIPNATHQFHGVDKQAIATYTRIGSRQGRWMPLLNDCIGWALTAIFNSTPHDIYIQRGPNGHNLPILTHRHVVAYADGSIHSPAE